MNDLDCWFREAAKRANRAPSLYSSLLTNKVFSYLGYRLRFSILLTTVRFVVHAVEFFVLFASLGGLATSVVMVLRIGGVLVGGAWWGLLDVMRERIRAFARAGERESSEREIGRWLVLSAFLAVVFCLCSAAALTLYLPLRDNVVAQVYGLLIIVEIAIGFPVRALHSGIFATRRVYRPTWSLFAPLIVQLVVLAGGFYFYPAAAIIVAIVTSNALGIWISVHFAREVYRLSGMSPKFSFSASVFWRSLPEIPLGKGIAATLSATGLRLDGVFVLGIVGVYGTDDRSFDLTAAVSSWSHVDTFQFFYLVLPLLRGSFGAADVYFFDFVRLHGNPALRAFQLAFFRKLLCLIPLVALYYWLLSTLLGVIVLSDVPVTFLVALMPLFVVRAFIGTYEIRLFAEGRSAVHIVAMVFLTFLLWLVWISPNPASDLIEITAAMTTELIVLINVQHLHDRRDLAFPALLTMRDWLVALGRESGSVLVGSIGIPDCVTSKQRSAAVEVVRDHVAPNGHFAFSSPTKLIYYQPNSSANGDSNLHRVLLVATGGIATRGRELTESAVDGLEAIRLLVSENWLGPIYSDVAGNDEFPRSGTPETLGVEFGEIFQGGVIVDLETMEGAREIRTWDARLLAQTVPAVTKCLESGTTMTLVSGRWITPIYFGGVLRLVCFLPNDPDAQLLRTWREAVRSWQMGQAAALAAIGAR